MTRGTPVVGSDPRAGRLRHVRWIGGGSGAGKSTTARALAARHGLRCVSTDDSMGEHAARSLPRHAPALQEFMAMDMDQRWVHRPPEVMLETFHWFRGEAFDLVVDDLLALPPEREVVVEGFRLLPHLVAPLLTRPEQGVWLLPSPRFRRAAFEARGTLWAVAGRTTDPPRALANLLERDRLFTERLRSQVHDLGLRGVEVDVSVDEESLLRRTAAQLGLDAGDRPPGEACPADQDGDLDTRS